MRNGFILIELLSVIIILAIISAITSAIINGIIYSVSLKTFAANEQMMINVTRFFLSTKNDCFPSVIGDTTEIKLSELQSNKLISVIKDPWNSNEVCDGYILVTKVSDTLYDYDPHLKCSYNYKADGYLTDGLVAYWRFDNNAYDYTPNNNKGTIQNVSATTNRFGVNNSALKFNGPSNFVDTNYDLSINYNDGMTISLWVNFTIDDTGGKIKNILGKNSREYLLSQVDNKIRFVQWNSSGDYAVVLVSNVNIEIDKWYNITVVYNNLANAFYLYINGELDVYDVTMYSSFLDKDESLKIGRGYPDIGAAASTFFIGSIDNISVYNRALSYEEIKLNYNIDQIMKE